MDSRGALLLLHVPHCHWGDGGVLNTTPRPLHCHERDTVGPRAGMRGCVKSRPSGIRSRTVPTAYATPEKSEEGRQ